MLRSSPDVYVSQVADAGVGATVNASQVKRQALVAWAVTLCGAVFFIALIVGAPLAAREGQPLLARVLYGSLHLVCHQIPERSFQVGAHPLAVCTRCFGVYTGFACLTLLYPLMRSLTRDDAPPRSLIIIALLPMCIDWTLGVTGLWTNTAWSRFATGAFLGACAAFYVIPGLVDCSMKLNGLRGDMRKG
ncbi:MAG: DUF2085 domain-containing protein [Pyrinomonadaceae bacterium MAG19_C2-C3]|nr:DUF2085 domain-containing protein [Pyrinomonadaceae bacterium MAG19_C2-C3]